MRHPRSGSPPQVLRAALKRLDQVPDLRVVAASAIVASAPVGPSHRRFANGAVVVETPLPPPALLSLLQRVEKEFGRRKIGQRWRARVMDLDIVLWSGGVWADPRLTLPHPQFRNRDFVLRPASAIAGDWRDPVTGMTIRQLHRRLTRMGSLPR